LRKDVKEEKGIKRAKRRRDVAKGKGTKESKGQKGGEL
jgi:hypothetical protein